MGAHTAITPEDLVRLPRPENGKHYELVHGELTVVGNAKLLHERIKRRIAKQMYRHAEMAGEVFVETMFVLNQETARIPDVAFVSFEKVRRLSDDDFARVAPDLAIEIISDSETARYAEDKVQDYLAGGVGEVWQVYSSQQIIRVRTLSGSRDWLRAETLATPLLPGFELQVQSVFADDRIE